MESNSIIGPKVPVVDLSKGNLRPGSSTWLSACNEIKGALEEYGCFVAVYDQISSESRKRVFESLEELFDVPTENKMKTLNTDQKLLGYWKSDYLPRCEGLVLQNATNLEEWKNFTNLMWPEGNDHFCEIAHKYTNMAAELDQLVMRMLFESYGINEKHYHSQKESTTYHLQLLKHGRTLTEEENVNMPNGLTYKGLLSIIYSDDVKGLELRTKDGEWMHFEPSPTSFAVVAGDVCMAWSNDRIKACYTRLNVDRHQKRYSLTLSSFLSGVIQPQEELVDDEHPLKYKPFMHLGLLKFFESSNDPIAKKMDSHLIKSYCGI